ncbi:hypothetical protein, partial [Pseudomonas marginalis]|uniref:hypothetical protein n=1 Tax=Pseudomonas marginalis TaxID=298 RepID=UPI002B1CB2DC
DWRLVAASVATGLLVVQNGMPERLPKKYIRTVISVKMETWLPLLTPYVQRVWIRICQKRY